MVCLRIFAKKGQNKTRTPIARMRVYDVLEVQLGHQLHLVVGNPMQVGLGQSVGGLQVLAVLGGGYLILSAQLELAPCDQDCGREAQQSVHIGEAVLAEVEALDVAGGICGKGVDGAEVADIAGKEDTLYLPAIGHGDPG